MANLLWAKYRDQKALKTYIGFYAGYWWKLGLVVILFWIKASPIYVIPVITADIINLLTGAPSIVPQELMRLFAIGALVIAQNVPMHMLYIHFLSRASRAVELNLRTALCARLQHLSMTFYTSSKAGVLQTKVLRDVENIESMTRLLVDNIPGVIATLVVAISVTATRAPLFIVFYMAIVPIAVLLFRIIGAGMKSRNRDFRLSVETMSGQVAEMLRLIPVTRAHHLEEVEMRRMQDRLTAIRDTGLRLDNINALFGSVNWSVMMFFNLVTLCVAALLFNRGIMHVGIGDVALLAGYFGQITGAAMQLLNFLPMITRGLESVKSVGEILECPDIEQNENKSVLHSVSGSFRFDRVEYQYPNSDRPALSDFSLDVKEGETIALVGASGAGKSTIAQLLIGFIRPTGGKIFLDGRDMAEIDLRTYRSFIAVVTQETILFDGTIRDNIAYGVPNATDDAIANAVKFASLEEFVASLPQGVDTRICENGARLSGGQRQRIAIARALLRNPRVLILDEATSALDVDSESEIKQALDRLMKGRTSFVVAHRLSTIRNADRIVVMADGHLVEIGTHEELIAMKGRYFEMYSKFNGLNA